MRKKGKNDPNMIKNIWLYEFSNSVRVLSTGIDSVVRSNFFMEATIKICGWYVPQLHYYLSNVQNSGCVIDPTVCQLSKPHSLDD